MATLKHPIASRNAGFSLIEVLISLVILSVGLLGIAAMVSVSMKSKNGSYLRTQALALSSAILDRMRANRATAITNAYDGSTAPTSPTSCNGTAVNCSTAQIAAMDLYEWHQEMLTLLGSDATYSITTTPVAQYNQVQVIIAWNDSPTNGSLNGSSNCGAPTSAATVAATVTAQGNTGCYNSIIITSGL